MARALCSRVTTVKTIVATAVVLVATVRVAIAVLVPVVAALAVVPRVPMAHRPMAATSLLSPLMPSAFARLPSPKRKENNHVAT